MKLFDAHNHIHLGPRGLAPLLETMPTPSVAQVSGNGVGAQERHPDASFVGAAIMSTHPRDYNNVHSVVCDLRKRNYEAVPCYGIHPWFLNDVLTDPESTRLLENGEEVWLNELRQRLQQNSDAIVGEIGLDGARWVEVEDEGDDVINVVEENNDSKEQSIWYRKRTLACPMNLQKDAFVKQLLLAAELQRPVSIHVVRAWGELFDSLEEVKQTIKHKHQQRRINESKYSDDSVRIQQSEKAKRKELLLPPKMYFHAFSGKVGVISSLLSACGKGNIDPNSDVFFGFPPIIPNFNAPKTPSVMKEIGLHRLLLETDYEDASCVWDDLIRGVEGIAAALDVDVEDVADQTYENAEYFYFGR
jgi:Tat protein secretion system quality control protein TatD with DNase activity